MWGYIIAGVVILGNLVFFFSRRRKISIPRESMENIMAEKVIASVPDMIFMYNPQIQISAESGTKRSIFRQKNKTKRSKKRLHTTLIKPEQKVNEDLCSGFILS